MIPTLAQLSCLMCYLFHFEYFVVFFHRFFFLLEIGLDDEVSWQ